jgi:hypothetical protein
VVPKVNPSLSRILVINRPQRNSAAENASIGMHFDTLFPAFPHPGRRWGWRRSAVGRVIVEQDPVRRPFKVVKLARPECPQEGQQTHEAQPQRHRYQVEQHVHR